MFYRSLLEFQFGAVYLVPAAHRQFNRLLHHVACDRGVVKQRGNGFVRHGFSYPDLRLRWHAGARLGR